MSLNKIVTHGGPKAHFDEFLGVALLLAEKGSIETPVYRREPTAEEIDDARVAVVDTGEEHNPDLLLFDHHQSENLPSSMRLVAMWLGLDLPFSRAFDWYRFKDNLDVRGPQAAARQEDIDGDIRPTQSPIEDYILRTFSEQEGRVARPLVKFMEGFARSLIERANEFMDLLHETREEGEVRKLYGERVFVMPGRDPDSQVLRTIREERERPFNLTITNDPRGPGVTVYRYDDANIDLSRASEEVDGVHFSHHSGFLACCEDVETAWSTIVWAKTGSPLGERISQLEEILPNPDVPENPLTIKEEIATLQSLKQ